MPKTILITGTSSGFGRDTAETLHHAGHTVYASMRGLEDKNHEAASALRKLGIKTVELDVSDDASVDAGVEKVLAEAGKIDVLINNAGIAGPSMPVVDYPVEQWKRVIDIDLNGPFLCCRAVVPHMVKAGYGRIVNIASIAGKEGNPNAAHYSASKAGLIALTKSLGKELAQHDILVNAVTPAAAKTAIFDQMTQQHIDFMLLKIPKGRFVLVEELAAMVAWLASEDCAFSTGAVFDISGGRATY